MKKSKDKPATSHVQGEGDYEAAQRYRKSVSDFVEKTDVEAVAKAAQPMSALEAREAASAEERARTRTKGDDPADAEIMSAGQTSGSMTGASNTAERAYSLWQRRGSPHGSPDADWYEAERQTFTPPTQANAAVDPSSVDESSDESFPASDPPATHAEDRVPSNAAEKWKASKTK
jgi:Protein of unknown function (DUF2934)